jgi:5-methylcytosine-specific restriction protein A
VGFHDHEGFSIHFRTGWRHAEALFVPGKYSRPLIASLGTAPETSRAAFAALAASAAKCAVVFLRVNGASVDPRTPSKWPSVWEKLELSIKRQNIVIEELSDSEFKSLLGDLLVTLFGMVIVLIGVDDFEADEGATEGDAIETVSRRYERKPINRRICLAIRGRHCYCCGLDFGAVYGEVAEGFIEVHHKTAVSEMGPGYHINPVEELFPVCSNCHSVIHLVRPALDPDVLRERIADRKR